jgi:predicted CoA-binding protein
VSHAVADAELRRIMAASRRIAVVGISDKPSRPSHMVARYLKDHGYCIVPVNPKLTEVLGEKCYPDLASIPEPVDMVDVFRQAVDCPPVAAAAVAVGAKVLWLQLGIVSEEARRIAAAGGLTVVMDRCLKIEHARLQHAGL